MGRKHIGTCTDIYPSCPPSRKPEGNGIYPSRLSFTYVGPVSWLNYTINVGFDIHFPQQRSPSQLKKVDREELRPRITP
jgi:hypothetical protein